MPLGFGRPSFLRRAGAPGPALTEGTAMSAPRLDADTAPVGPPVLMPAAITRRVLIEATEVIPIWARPRPMAESLAAPVAPPPARSTAAPRTRREAAETTATTVGRAKATKRATPRAKSNEPGAQPQAPKSRRSRRQPKDEA